MRYPSLKEHRAPKGTRESLRVDAEFSPSHERLRLLLNALPFIVCFLAPDGTTLFVNSALQKIAGYTPKEVQGRNWWHLFYPGDNYRQVVALFRKLEERFEVQDYEMTLTAKDRNERVISWNFTNGYDEQGTLVEIMGLGIDLTERKQMEAALRISEERYKKQFEEAMDAIFVADAETGIIVDCNRVASELVGREKSELVGKHQRILHPPEEIQGEFSRTFKQHLKEKEGQVLETQVITKKGEIKDVAIKANIFDLEGQKMILGIFRDITEQKRAGEELWESHERYKELADSIADVFFAMDKDLRYTYWNKASEDLTGISAKDAIGKSLYEIFPEVKGTRADKLYLESLRTQQPQIFENEYQLGDRNYIFEISTYPSAEGLSVFVKDITERKRAEKELQRRLAELATLNEIGRAIASTMELDKLWELIYQQTCRVMEVSSFYIAVHDPKKKELRSVIYMLHGQRNPADELPRKFAKGRTEYIIRARKPLLIRGDVQRAYRRLGIVSSDKKARAFAGVPIAVGGKVIGVLAVQNYERDDAYDEHTIELLSAIAHQAAVAIENARLFAEREQRVTELAALYDISLDVAGQLDLNALLKTILLRAIELLKANDGGLYLYHPERQELELIVHQGLGQDYTGTIMALGEGTCGKVAQSGKPLVVIDYANWEGRSPQFADETSFNALAVPIKRGDTLLGVLVVDDPNLEKRFDEGDIRLATLFANQTAIAIENARLFAEREHRVKELAALHDVSLEVVAKTNLSEMLPTIVQRATQLLDAQAGGLYLYHPEIKELEMTVSHGYSKDYKGTRLALGEGLSGKVAQSQQPLMVDDYAHWVGRSPQWEEEPTGGALGVPLMRGDQLLGVLYVDRGVASTFDERALQLATLFANQAAIAIENARLFEAEHKRATQLAIINEVGKKAISILDLDEMLREVASSICSAFDYYSVALFLVDKDRNEAVMRAIAGGFQHIAPGAFRQSIDEGIIGFVTRTGQSRLANEVTKDPYYIKGFSEEVLTRSELCVPVKLGSQITGALDAQSLCPNAFDEADVTAMETLSGQIAVAIENAHAYQRLEEQNLQTIAALVSAVEARDPYTSGHSHEVTAHAVAIAEKLGLSEKEIEGLRWAGLLHDVGKIGVSDAVLSKPGRLTTAEYMMIKAHPIISADIVGKVEGLTHLVPIIRHHHEWYDGNGYPDGLKGEEIPLGARILAVADGFDAMMAERPYRMAKSREEALAEIKAGAGTQWDPKVVKAFLAVTRKGNKKP